MKINIPEAHIVKTIVNTLLAIYFQSLTSFNPITPRRNEINVTAKTIFNGWIPMFLVNTLIKLSDDIEIKNKGIQNKESRNDDLLILIFIHTSLWSWSYWIRIFLKFLFNYPFEQNLPFIEHFYELNSFINIMNSYYFNREIKFFFHFFGFRKICKW